jgi:hypothetical protein
VLRQLPCQNNFNVAQFLKINLVGRSQHFSWQPPLPHGEHFSVHHATPAAAIYSVGNWTLTQRHPSSKGG